jgi:N-hydroxyarylamine O-acetyltransferase
VQQGHLDPGLVERVLGRLGLLERPEPDLGGLTEVYASWCRGVPFDNVQKRIHRAEGNDRPLPGDAPADFLETWLAEGTGGTCWAGNGALCGLLTALGFPAERGVATMLVAPGLPPNHGTVSVAFGDMRFLVDASMLHDEPLALRADAETRAGGAEWGAEARFEDGSFVIRWRPLYMESLDCRIESLSGTESEFTRRHEETRAWSPFNYQLSARLQRQEGPIGAAFGRRAGISAGAGLWSRPFEPEERTRFLVEELGIRESTAVRLPPDEPMPPPPGAPTAEEW